MSIQALAHQIARVAVIDGEHTTAFAPLCLYRSSARTDPTPCIYGLGLAVVAQGHKQVVAGEQVLNYGPGQSLLVSADLPVIGQIDQADVAHPFLCAYLALDARALLQMAAELDLPPAGREQVPRALSLNVIDTSLIEAVIRLVQLLEEPELVNTLAPLVQQEIMARLLVGPHGPNLRHIVAGGTPSHQVAQAMAWLRLNYKNDFPIDELAARAHMSPSTFRLHFRGLTGMSPLQYQKQLRLQEARQLMMNEALDAGTTAARVGYESASQFSRDYSRLFGEPPQRDIRRMRDPSASRAAAPVHRLAM
ncbi:AraC-like DNA-binding protein [Hydrogenophaga palleronii]|uniref:AraC-like DNA-binding protein n=1 Tax=Hydrogenophaga palleronii TaxID=65655 RepID=A0ABU1WHR2_9BURK|nr:AraC family transcriptional regulator [Hydrogenophaga palleronii]MDR7148532.1 AraC-like DNA-binding protein [Hydrogenophaga palleronii]